MARFSPSNYDPSVDSSPGAPSNGNLVLIYKDDSACRCGCGGEPKNPKRSFIQGHDARLKGALIRAAATDTKVEVRQGKNSDTITALAAAKVFGFSAQVSKAKAAYAEKAKVQAQKVKDREARQVTAEKAKAEKAKAAATKKAAAAKAKKAAAKKAPATRKAAAPKADAVEPEATA